MANDLDVLGITISGEIDDSELVQNDYQLELHETGGLADSLVVSDILEWVDDLYTILKALLNVLVVLRELKIINKTQGTLIGTYTFGTPYTGTATGSMLPAGACFLAGFPTKYPRVVGRKFWGPNATSIITSDGLVGSGAQTVLGNAIALLVAPYAATNGTYFYGYESPKTGTFVNFDQGYYSVEPAYQRRRRRGTGD